MRKSVALAVSGLFLALCIGNAGFPASASNRENETEVTQQDMMVSEKVKTVQLGVVRFTPDEFGKARLETLLEQLYDPDLLAADVAVDESDPTHTTITVYYEGGEKDTFCFHKMDDVWYMKKEDGTVVSGASFIETYVSYGEGGGVNTASIGIPEKELLACFAEEKALDERAVFIQSLKSYLDQGMEKAEAEERVRAQQRSSYLLYQYALQNEYDVDGAANMLKEWMTDAYEIADNLQELETVLAEVGLTLEEYQEMQSMLLWKDAAEQAIYSQLFQEYRHGNTAIGDHDCSDFTEYWNTFLLEVVSEEMKDYDMTEYEKVLDEAAAFAWEYLE